MERGYHHPTHLRFEALCGPVTPLDLGRVDTLLVLLGRGSLVDNLPTIVTSAAVFRAILLERGVAPDLKVMHEVGFLNSLQGFGDNSFLGGIRPGSHALLLTDATLYKRQMAVMLGAYALEGATLEAFPSLVDDDVKLGARTDPDVKVFSLVRHALRECSDPWTQRLVRIASTDWEGRPVTDPLIASVSEALETIQALSFPWVRGAEKDPPPRPTEAVTSLITEWGNGVELPSRLLPLMTRYQESLEIARTMWHSCAELSPGVFELIEFPRSECDEVIRRLMRKLYTEDARARLVLERGIDRGATKLAYDEAIDFERRLSGGEDPGEVLAEVEEILTRRKDTGTLSQIELSKDRERDLSEILDAVLRDSQYIPDESGYCYTVLKSPREEILYDKLQELGIPLITHNTVWVHNLAARTSRPFQISFQARYLDPFLAAVDSLGEWNG